MSTAHLHALNDIKLINIRDVWFDRLHRLFAGNDDTETVFALNGINGQATDNSLMYSEPERWVAECLGNLAESAEQAQNTDVFTPLCVEYSAFGVHFVDSIFGCNVYFKDGQWQSDYLSGEIGALTAPDLDKSEPWQLAIRAAKAFTNADVTLPLFGLPTIASALNIAVNLYGEQILTEMLCNPENAAHDLKVINDTLIELHRRMLKLIPANQLQPVCAASRTQPPGFGQLCGCTTQLISPDCYREMAAPFDSELLSVYPHGGMIHLCGTHEHHIPAFRETQALRSFQLNDRASEGLAEYYNGLRADQIIYFTPCEKISAEKAVEITGGERLVLIGSHQIKKRSKRV